DEAVQHGAADIGIDLDPPGSGEHLLHGFFRAQDQEVDHVTGIAGLIADAAGGFGKQGGVAAGNRSDVAQNDVHFARGRRVYLDPNRISAVAGIVGCLIDADRETSADGSLNVAFRTDEQRLRDIFVADTRDYGAAPRLIVGKHAYKVLESAREALWAVILFGVGVAQLAIGCD